MKKLFVLLVICIAVFVGMLITSFASEKIGDVNDDGKITAADARWIYTKKVDKCDIIKNIKNKTSKERKKCQKKVQNTHLNSSKR